MKVFWIGAAAGYVACAATAGALAMWIVPPPEAPARGVQPSWEPPKIDRPLTERTAPLEWSGYAEGWKDGVVLPPVGRPGPRDGAGSPWPMLGGWGIGHPSVPREDEQKDHSVPEPGTLALLFAAGAAALLRRRRWTS